MPRPLTPEATANLLRQEAADQLVAFLTISHEDINPPIRVVCDAATFAGNAMTYSWRGETWQAFPFELKWVTDTDAAPTARLVVPNVDRLVGQAVDALVLPPTIRIDLCLAGDFDLTANPRVGLSGDPDPEATADGFDLVDVEANVLTVQGTLKGWDYRQEVFPNMIATQSLTPALYP